MLSSADAAKHGACEREVAPKPPSEAQEPTQPTRRTEALEQSRRRRAQTASLEVHRALDLAAHCAGSGGIAR
eukprot:5813389-Alexandrium_andersonii.AAC.1